MAENTAVDTQAPDNTDDLTQKLIGWFKTDLPHVLEWRKEAREDFKFYAGDQWAETDKDVLANQGRPVMTFNRTAPLVNAVTGSEINNRREVRYIPREMGDAEGNELLTNAGEWFRDQTDAEDEESDGFHDATVGGMGWLDTRLDYETDPDGAPVIEKLDPFKMVWSATATKANLVDSERYFYVDEKTWDDAQQMFPDVPKEMLNASWAVNLMRNPGEPHRQDPASSYDGSQSEYGGESRKLCTIVEARWLERVPYHRGPDLQNPGQLREYADEQVELIQKQVPGFKTVRQYKKVLRRAFIGAKVLAPVDSPPVPDGMVGWECITGFHDRIKNQFYGIVRPVKDPQRWSNKYFSQVMYLLNSKSKGGVLAERGSFEDDNQAELSWAKSDTITWAAPGALSSGNPRIQPKPESQFPAGFWTLFEETKESISQVTGLSQEFIGTREVDQANVLEATRRQSSLNLLAPLFNSLRRYRKRQGRIMLYLIQNYLSDGRLIKIVGQDKAQYVPLVKTADIKYDIIIDDAPSSPNEKERTWGILMQLLPLVKDMMPPQMMMQILKYTPLPASLVDAIQQQAQQMAQQPPPPDPMQAHMQMKMQHEQAKAQLDIQGKQADVQAKQQTAQINVQSQAQAAQITAQQKNMDLFYENQKNQQDAQMQAFQQQLDMQKMALQERQMQIMEKRAQAAETRAAEGH